MSYVFSIHTNKAHPHIHFSFIEKKPNYSYCDGKINYRRKGKITIDEQRYLKRLVELTIEREKYYTPLLVKTNKDIDDLKSYFNPQEKNLFLNDIDEIFIEEKIMKLGILVKEYRNQHNQTSQKVKFNSIKNNELGKEIKSLTRDIKKYLFHDENSILQNSRQDINNDLQSLNGYFDSLNKKNNIDELTLNNAIVKKKEEYIDNYIYNSIVNHSLYKYQHISRIVKSKNNHEKITMDDLIQEIAYQNRSKKDFNDLQRRKNILDNYFKCNSGNTRFPSRYKMEQSLKNINYEMEKAMQEFSKLFNYDEKKR